MSTVTNFFNKKICWMHEFLGFEQKKCFFGVFLWTNSYDFKGVVVPTRYNNWLTCRRKNTARLQKQLYARLDSMIKFLNPRLSKDRTGCCFVFPCDDMQRNSACWTSTKSVSWMICRHFHTNAFLTCWRHWNVTVKKINDTSKTDKHESLS